MLFQHVPVVCVDVLHVSSGSVNTGRPTSYKRFGNEEAELMSASRYGDGSHNSGIAVIATRCGPSTIARFAFACGGGLLVENSLSDRSQGDQPKIVLSRAAQRRMHDTLRWFDEHLLLYQRGGDDGLWKQQRSRAEGRDRTADTVTMFTPMSIPAAASVTFSTLESAVGETTDAAWLADGYLAPYFLDMRRVVAQGEFLLLPFRSAARQRSKSDAADDQLVFEPPRLFWVSAIEAVPTPSIDDDCPLAEVSEDTCIYITEVCRGPIHIAMQYEQVGGAMRRGTSPPAQEAEELSPAPANPKKVHPIPPIDDAATLDERPASATMSPTADATLRDVLDVDHDTENTRCIEAARLQRVHECIRTWHTLRGRWDEERLFSSALKKSYADHHADFEGSWSESQFEARALLDVRQQYRLASVLRDCHQDVIHYMEDPCAHPTRGNVLRLERMSSLHSSKRRAPRSGPDVSNGLDFAERLKRTLRENLGIVVTSVFVTGDGHVAYATVSTHCMPTLEDHFLRSANASHVLIDVPISDLHFDDDLDGKSFQWGVLHKGPGGSWAPQIMTWTGVMLTTTTLEDLCRRREHQRQRFLSEVERGRPLEALKHLMAERHVKLEKLYLTFCAVAQIPPLDMKRPDEFISSDDTDDVADENQRTVRGMIRLLQKRTNDAERLLSDLFDTPTSTSLASVDGRDPSRGQEEHRCAQTLAELEAAYRPLQQLLKELSSGSSTLEEVRQRLLKQSNDQMQQRAVARHMELALFAYATVLKPFLEEFLPVVVPAIAMSTDHRASPELLRFLTASTRAQQSRGEIPLLEAELTAFQLLQSSAPPLPRIPPFRLLVQQQQ